MGFSSASATTRCTGSEPCGWAAGCGGALCWSPSPAALRRPGCSQALRSTDACDAALEARLSARAERSNVALAKKYTASPLRISSQDGEHRVGVPMRDASDPGVPAPRSSEPPQADSAASSTLSRTSSLGSGAAASLRVKCSSNTLAVRWPAADECKLYTDRPAIGTPDSDVVAAPLAITALRL